MKLNKIKVTQDEFSYFIANISSPLTKIEITPYHFILKLKDEEYAEANYQDIVWLDNRENEFYIYITPLIKIYKKYKALIEE